MIELPDEDYGWSEDDFGLSFVNEEELEVYNKSKKLESEVKANRHSAEALQKKLVKLRNMIMPLLENLRSQPEKEYILWPNRAEKIEQFIERIDKFIQE